jgi:hypothetical protein
MDFVTDLPITRLRIAPSTPIVEIHNDPLGQCGLRRIEQSFASPVALVTQRVAAALLL